MNSYNTPFEAISSDITKVGGLTAYLGMIREYIDGKRFTLVQSHDVSITSPSGKLILAFKGGQVFKVTLAVNTGRCNGVPAAVYPIAIGDYFWMQISGRADGVVVVGGTAGTFVSSAASGIGNPIPNLVANIAHTAAGDADFTLIHCGVVGWEVTAADANSLASIEINPDFQWSGTGTPLSITTGDEVE